MRDSRYLRILRPIVRLFSKSLCASTFFPWRSLGREAKRGTPEFGAAFETYLMHELTSYRDYLSGEPLSYWRSTSGFEVDFILGDHTAIEA